MLHRLALVTIFLLPSAVGFAQIETLETTEILGWSDSGSSVAFINDPLGRGVIRAGQPARFQQSVPARLYSHRPRQVPTNRIRVVFQETAVREIGGGTPGVLNVSVRVGQRWHDLAPIPAMSGPYDICDASGSEECYERVRGEDERRGYSPNTLRVKIWPSPSRPGLALLEVEGTGAYTISDELHWVRIPNGLPSTRYAAPQIASHREFVPTCAQIEDIADEPWGIYDGELLFRAFFGDLESFVSVNLDGGCHEVMPISTRVLRLHALDENRIRTSTSDTIHETENSIVLPDDEEGTPYLLEDGRFALVRENQLVTITDSRAPMTWANTPTCRAFSHGSSNFAGTINGQLAFKSWYGADEYILILDENQTCTEVLWNPQVTPAAEVAPERVRRAPIDSVRRVGEAIEVPEQENLQVRALPDGRIILLDSEEDLVLPISDVRIPESWLIDAPAE